MRALIQRVRWSDVKVGDVSVGSTGPGMLVFLGVAQSDDEGDARYLARKAAGLRIFEDGQGKMNFSIRDTGGEVMVVSQFTLVADTGKGNRPGFGNAAPPEQAEGLYDLFIEELKALGNQVRTGVFGGEMAVSLLNQGPVTILLESQDKTRK